MDNKCFELGANEQPLDIIKETCGFAGIFKQIGVIGGKRTIASTP